MVSLSVCCGAPLRQHEGEEGTRWFTCSACKRPADAAPDPTVSRSVWCRLGLHRWPEPAGVGYCERGCGALMRHRSNGRTWVRHVEPTDDRLRRPPPPPPGMGNVGRAPAQSDLSQLGVSRPVVAELLVSGETTPCADCGSHYGDLYYWLTSDDLWARVVGRNDVVLCVPCFTTRMEALR